MLAVGFADMVGFTLLSQHLGEDELAAVVRRFEEISHDIVTGLGGRVVKMIGDEAMFVVDSVVAAARIGLGLAEAYADDELLSDVRVGLAVGPVLVHDGDYFGPTVNLGPPDRQHRQPRHGAHVRRVPRRTGGRRRPTSSPAAPCGPGCSRTWGGCSCGGAVVPARSRTAPASRPTGGRNVRWERLAEVLRDLDDLREVGERLLSKDRRAELIDGRHPDDPKSRATAGAVQASATRKSGDPEGP